jgi:hypothetical protein
MGRKFEQIAALDASLIKFSLAAFSWATYCEKTGAAKITSVLNWVQGVPEQFVFTASGKIHDLKAAAALTWSAGWTYLFDRRYFSFDLLVNLPAGVRAIKLDQTVSLSGWGMT